MATARLAGEPPAAEEITPRLVIPLGPCDATASGAEDAQVRLSRGRHELNFCAHHYQKLELALLAAGWVITHDSRGQD